MFFNVFYLKIDVFIIYGYFFLVLLTVIVICIMWLCCIGV